MEGATTCGQTGLRCDHCKKTEHLEVTCQDRRKPEVRIINFEVLDATLEGGVTHKTDIRFSHLCLPDTGAMLSVTELEVVLHLGWPWICSRRPYCGMPAGN